MLFLLGYLDTRIQESIYIGDPCYVDSYRDQSRTDLMIKYDQPWVKLDPSEYSHDIEARMQALIDKKLVSVYVDMYQPRGKHWSLDSADYKAGYRVRAGNGALILWFDQPHHSPTTNMIKSKKLKRLGFIGADSGQISILTAKAFDSWVINRDLNQKIDSTDDYDACSQVSLDYQLKAGAHKRHDRGISGQPSEVMASVFTSATYEGDGYFGVYEILSVDQTGIEQSIGIVIDFVGQYSKGEDQD